MRHTTNKMCTLVSSVVVGVLLLVGTASFVQAATPYLQVTTNDNFNYHIVVKSADPFRVVDFYTRQSDTQLWTTLSNIGATDGSGYLSKQININSYNPSLSRESYVIVNGQQSSSAFTGSSSGSGNVWFSPSNPTMNIGQSLAVSINSSSTGYVYPSYSNSYYISSNNNPNVVSASISGTVLNLYANAIGSSAVTVTHSSLGWSGTLYVSVSGTVYGTSLYTNGQLLNQNGTIYIVYKNMISGFTHAEAFVGLGFNFSNATNVGFVNIPTSGYIIGTQYTSHPWGSWVKSGQTVYFVHQDGLIPISSYDIFLNNGGQDRLVVLMNSHDWQRPQLPVMTYRDYRLQ